MAALLFFSSSTDAQRYLLNNETVVFSFNTQNGKHVTLARDKSNSYIVYRYGTPDSVELEFPEKSKESWKKFKYAWYLRGGGAANAGMDLNYFYFTTNGYRYYIYDVYYAEEKKYGIGVGVTDLKTNKTITIRGVKKTQKGTLINLRDNNLVERDEDMIDVGDINP